LQIVPEKITIEFFVMLPFLETLMMHIPSQFSPPVLHNKSIHEIDSLRNEIAVASVLDPFSKITETCDLGKDAATSTFEVMKGCGLFRERDNQLLATLRKLGVLAMVLDKGLTYSQIILFEFNRIWIIDRKRLLMKFT
jgi:hypothetical protein